MAVYKALTKTIKLENLSEGQTINRKKYIEKLKVFKLFEPNGGTYIVDNSYREYGEIGLHYYTYNTLIEYFSKFNTDEITIRFRNGKINCQ